MKKNKLRNAAQVYLSIAPFVVILFVLATGRGSYYLPVWSMGFFLPIWIMNIILMIISAWFLGAYTIKNNDTEKKQLAFIACFLIAPFLFLSLVGGMGAPPESLKETLENVTRERIRYSFIITSGILMGIGLILLREKLRQTKGNFYAQLGYAAIVIALPVFIVVNSFWHTVSLSVTSDIFNSKAGSGSASFPEWFSFFRNQVWVLNVAEVCLTYLAIAAFASALKAAQLFHKTPSLIYSLISFLAIICILSYPSYASQTVYPDFPFIPLMIPAVPMLVIYYIGINLLRKAGEVDGK
ncbi:MAG: hypothetical protein GC171_04305 [Terrimonas sp.]|nr:hypothetical protein [Terrimonas sp.]